MTEPKDKRTKEYKEWKAKFDNWSLGFGDVVEKITKATGIKNAVEFVAGKDCGCDERKERLNRMFRTRRTNCPTEEHFLFMQEFFKTNKNRIQKQEQEQIVNILNHVFNRKLEPTRCGSCVAGWINELKRLYETYK